MQSLSLKKKRVSAQRKAVAAVSVLLDVVEGRMDEQAADARLQEQIGQDWSLMSCLQYLAGQEALVALKALPNDWSSGGRERRQLLEAAGVVHDSGDLRAHGTKPWVSAVAQRLDCTLAPVPEGGPGKHEQV